MRSKAWRIAIVLAAQTSILLAQEDSANSNEAQENVALDTLALAILPVEILTDHPRSSALGEDAHRRVVSALASIEGLYILGEDSVNPYADSDLSPVEIGRQLGVANVLESVVRVHGTSITLDVRVVDAQGRGSSFGSGLPIGLSDPSHTHVTIFGMDGEPTRIDAEDLLDWALPDFVRRVESAVFPNPASDTQPTRIEREAIFLDTSRSEAERLEALSRLYSPMNGRRGIESGAETLSNAVVVAATEMALYSENASVRANVWRQVDGVDDPYLIQPLLHSLSNDPDEDVREEAAKTLKGFLDAPEVRGALEYAWNYDTSETVRREARYSMLSSTEQQAMLREIVLDTTLTDWERWRAFYGLREEHAVDSGLDPELHAALVELARSASDSGTRRSIWNWLSQVDDPGLVDPLLSTLTSDPDEEVREVVVRALQQYLGQPGVVEALESVLVTDTSPLVRSAAEQSLNSVAQD